MTIADNEIIEIISAKYLENYQISLQFNNGKKRIVDFEPFLQKSTNPWIRRYLDPDLFRNFNVKHGDLMWNDYDLCFPIAGLYEGSI